LSPASYTAFCYGGIDTREIGSASTHARAEALIEAYKTDLARRCCSTLGFMFWVHENKPTSRR